MGDLDPVSVHLGQMTELLSDKERFRITFVLGVQAEADMAEAALPAVGFDMKFSGWKRLGKLRNFIKHDPGRVGFTVYSFPYGGWIVAEKGRAPGARVPSRVKRPVTLATPWGPRTYLPGRPLIIGGTRGRGSLTIGHTLVRLRTTDRFRKQVHLRMAAIYHTSEVA